MSITVLFLLADASDTMQTAEFSVDIHGEMEQKGGYCRKLGFSRPAPTLSKSHSKLNLVMRIIGLTFLLD